MDNLFEIIASVVGIVLYFLLSSKDDKKKKASKGPENVQPPIQRPAPKPKAEPAPAPAPVARAKPKPKPEPKYEAITFEELLEQFGQPKKPQQAGKNPLSTRAEMEAKYGIDDEYVPATPARQKAYDELKYFKENSVLGDSIGRNDLKDQRDSFFKEEKPAPMNRYAKMFRNPQSLRDMLIAKEIFDTKYF